MLWICACLAEPQVAAASWDAYGNLLVQDFTLREYEFTSWHHVFQGENGFIYYPYKNQVIEFDGVHRRAITVNDSPGISAICPGPNKSIFVVTLGDFGCIRPASDGEFRYHSHKSDFSSEMLHLDGGIVQMQWQDEALYFRALTSLYRWREGRGEVLYNDGLVLHTFFFLRNRLYISHGERGLLTYYQEQWHPVSTSGAFIDRNHQQIVGAFPERDGHIRLVTVDNRFWDFDGQELTPVDLPDWQPDYTPLYQLFYLKDGAMVIPTNLHGLFILSPDGHIRHRLTHREGLKSDNIFAACLDRQEGIWLHTQLGVNRILPGLPFTIFNVNHGIEGDVSAVNRFEGRLLASVQNYYLQSPLEPGCPGPFLQLNRITSLNSEIVVAYDSLFYTHDYSFYRMSQGHTEQMLPGRKIYAVHQAINNPERLYAQEINRIHLLERQNGAWVQTALLEESPPMIVDIVEETPSSIWLESGFGMVHRFELSGGRATLYKYGVEDGLNEEWISPLIMGGEIVFRSRSHIFRFDKANSRFIVSPELTAQFPVPLNQLWRVYPDQQGDLWISDSFHSGVMRRRADGQYDWDPLRLGMLNPLRISHVYRENDIAWLSTNKGIIRYDLQAHARFPRQPSAVRLRSIQQLQANSTWYDGHLPLQGKLEFPFSKDTWRISYSLVDFFDPEQNEFQIWVQGFQKDWTAWSKDNFTDLTNLAPGSYAFFVRGRNSLGDVSPAVSFSFEVIPPWYRKPWAWITYAAALLILLRAYLAWRHYSLRKDNLRLESLVQERTCQIETVTRAKSRLLANLSREMRAPLQGINGLCGFLLSAGLKTEIADCVRTIRSSTQHTLEIINHIVDMALLETGQLQLEPKQVALTDLLDDCLNLLANRSGKSPLIFFLRDNELPWHLLGDPLRLQQILTVLLEQALSLVPGGRLAVHISSSAFPLPQSSRDQHDPLPVRLEFRIGLGHGKDSLAKAYVYFLQFGQEESTELKRYGGSELGLFLARGLIERMGGKLEVVLAAGDTAEVRFSFVLPSVQPPRRDETYDALWAARVLLLTSDPLERESLTLPLAAGGMVYTCLTGLRQGLDELRKQTLAGNPYEFVLIGSQLNDGTPWDGMEIIGQDPACGQPRTILVLLPEVINEFTSIEPEPTSKYIPWPLRSRELYAAMQSAITERPRVAMR